MKKSIKCSCKCSCGGTEFITQPNQCEIYKVINNKLVYVYSETLQEDLRLYCIECSKELKDAKNLIYKDKRCSF